jgi:hypothetical protein
MNSTSNFAWMLLTTIIITFGVFSYICPIKNIGSEKGLNKEFLSNYLYNYNTNYQLNKVII